jgi:hypothetical protein
MTKKEINSLVSILYNMKFTKPNLDKNKKETD